MVVMNACTRWKAVGGDVMEGMREMAARGITPDEGTLLGDIICEH